MCTVSVKVDEDMLRGLLPELENTAAIRRWAQQLIDLHIQQIRVEKGREALNREATKEDLWHAIEQDPELTLKPSVITADDDEAVNLESFRADLHRMVEEIYAEG